MEISRSRKILQYMIAVLALAPLLSGIAGLAGIYNPIFLENLPENLILDSNLRFLNGMSIAVALAFYFLIPVIEKETFACRIICFAIFAGGIGRLISIFALGNPPAFILTFLVIELSCPLLIIYWQKHIANATLRQ